MGLYIGTLVLNIGFLVVGYALLSTLLRDSPLREWVSYAGIAFLAGVASVGVVLCAAATVGTNVDPATGAITAVGLVILGVVAGLRVPTRIRRGLSPVSRMPPAGSKPEDAIATLAFAGLVFLLGTALVGAFRSSPWLDDTWFFWLPKGIAIERMGLDTRLFTDDLAYWFFERNDNPLLWSIQLNLNVRAAGDLDLRSVNVQVTLLVIAFAAATARLLWGWVRPAILWPGLVFVISAPELLRQAQGGGADLPMAIYLVLFAVASGVWIATRRPFYLILAAAFASAAVAIKAEGVIELFLFASLLTLFTIGLDRRAALLVWAAPAAAIVTMLPWYAWRAVHGVQNVFSLRDALDPSYLADNTENLRLATRFTLDHLFDPREWSVLVPAAVLLGVFGALRERRVVWLAPVALLVVGGVFWIWISWADPIAEFRLVHSSYRYVVPMTIALGVSVPVMVERLVARRRPSSGATP